MLCRLLRMRLRVAAVVVSAAVFAACGSGSDPSASTPTTAPGTAPGPTVVDGNAATEATVDWEARTVTVSNGPDGYMFDFCDGDAQMICVDVDGETIGSFELGTYPADGVVLDDQGAEAWAAEFVETIGADRKAGCDQGFEVVADDVIPADFAGEGGVRYGYTARLAGRVAERVVVHAAVVDGALRVLALNALGADGCMGRELELPLDVAEDLTPTVAAFAAGSVNLPPLPGRLAPREIYLP